MCEAVGLSRAALKRSPNRVTFLVLWAVIYLKPLGSCRLQDTVDSQKCRVKEIKRNVDFPSDFKTKTLFIASMLDCYLMILVLLLGPCRVSRAAF